MGPMPPPLAERAQRAAVGFLLAAVATPIPRHPHRPQPRGLGHLGLDARPIGRQRVGRPRLGDAAQ